MTPTEHFVASPASMARWSDAAEFIEDFCARHGVERDAMYRLTFLAEELFTNAVVHGSAARVRLEVGIAEEALELLFEDNGPPFDPLAYARENPPDGPPEARPPGGLGLSLVDAIAESARYARVDGCNRVWLTLALKR